MIILCTGSRYAAAVLVGGSKPSPRPLPFLLIWAASAQTLLGGRRQLQWQDLSADDAIACALPGHLLAQVMTNGEAPLFPQAVRFPSGIRVLHGRRARRRRLLGAIGIGGRRLPEDTQDGCGQTL
jgi:hypothetical protein